MNLRTTILYITFLLILGSCQKDIDIFTPNNTVGADTNWVATVLPGSLCGQLKTALVKDPVADSIDATIGGTITTSEGLTLIIAPLIFQKPGGIPVVSGKIYFETILIKNRGDMVRMDRPTTSNGRMLISGGEIFIKAMKEGDELQLIPGKKIYIKYPDASASSQMRLFIGDESNPEQFNWIQSPDSTAVSLSTQPGLGYQLSSGSLRWINCDYFGDSSGQRVNVTASLPIDCTNANTTMFLVFKDLKSVMGMYGNMNTKKFSSQKVPVGKNAVVVSITKKANNSYFLAYEHIVTGSVGSGGINTTHVVALSPHPMSLTDIKSYLATL